MPNCSQINYPVGMNTLKKLFVVLLVLLFFMGVSSRPAYALNAKAKVMISTGAYGMVCGALLGVSTLAFGTSGRAVAQGASIGLWTGMLFGGYIILSHMYARDAQNRVDSYATPDPYDSEYGTDDGGATNDDGPEVDGAGNPLERWNPYQAMREFQRDSSWANRLPQQPVYKSTFYMNVLNISF